MEVAISMLRAELAAWVARAHAGEDVVITERGTPVARLLGIDSTPVLQDLERRGVIGRAAPGGRPPAREAERVVADGPVADLVSDLRD